jgi:hypothetical protein
MYCDKICIPVLVENYLLKKLCKKYNDDDTAISVSQFTCISMSISNKLLIT